MKITQISKTAQLGMMDAFHVPARICRISPKAFDQELLPGSFVRFTDDEMQEVELVEEGELYHGVVSPFITDKVRANDMFWVLIHPSASSNLRHEFTINLDQIDDKFIGGQKQIQYVYVEGEDDGCRGCYN